MAKSKINEVNKNINAAADETVGKESENNTFLERLGIKEAIKLSPIPTDYKSEEILTIVYNIDESDLPYTATLDVSNSFEMMVDAKSKQKLKKEVVFKTAGLHIIRVLGYFRRLSGSYPADCFPGSELIKLPDKMERIYDDDEHPLDGAKKLLLGTNYCGDISCFYNFDEIAVVPENPYLEMQDSCIIRKETQELVYMPAKSTEIPNGVKGIVNRALDMFSSAVLRIPGSVKEYAHITNQNIKEIIFEEGVVRARIFRSIFERVSLQTVHIPSSLEILDFTVDMDSLVVPASVRVACFCDSHIKHLEIQGDITLQKKYSFENFVGAIFLLGNIKPFEKFEAGKPEAQKFLGKMSDGCIIHVKDENVAQTLRECADFNPNVKIIVE